MENISTSSSKRFVIEDSIPKATSDGEPHEIMTIVAMISGLIAAAIVLFILVSLIGTRRRSNESEDGSEGTNGVHKDSKPEPLATIIPMFGSSKKCDEWSDKSRPQLLSISSISERLPSPEGRINYGFQNCPSNSCNISSTVTLSGISTVQC